MKKIVTLAALLAMSSTAFAGFQDTNASNNLTTVQAAQKMADHAPVTLEGNFVRQIDDDEFVFRDSVDKDFGEPTSIEVHQIQKIQ